MNKRATYLLAVLEKIGVPLMDSVITPLKGQERHSDMAVQIAQDAENIASLLARTVATSINLSTQTKIEELGENSDALRVALAGVAAPLIADLYRAQGAVPDEVQTARVANMLKNVMTFAENFTPGIDEIARLSSLQATGEAVDKHQISVQYMQAFTPVVSAVRDPDAARAIGQRLTEKAREMREQIFPQAGEAEASRVELGMLRALAELYAACYKDKAGDQTATDEAFALRSTVLLTLTHAIVTGESVQGQNQSAGEVIPAPAAAPESTPPPAVQAPPPPVEVPPPQVEETPPPAPTPAEEPLPQELPPAAPPPTETPTVPPAEPPPAPPAETPPAKDSGNGNPMSFFASKPKEGEG